MRQLSSMAAASALRLEGSASDVLLLLTEPKLRSCISLALWSAGHELACLPAVLWGEPAIVSRRHSNVLAESSGAMALIHESRRMRDLRQWHVRGDSS